MEMKCPNCGGMCEFTEFDGLRKVYFKRKCEVCNGTGQVKKTNFEDITSSPERLADFIFTVTQQCHCCGATEKVKMTGCAVRQTFAPNFFFLPCMDEVGTVNWLKEEHHADAAD